MEDIMNRIDFYTNLTKFKKKDDELKHGGIKKS